MKAWEKEREIMDNAIPKVLEEEEQTWLNANVIEESVDNMTRMLWHSNVPGSYAPESIMTAIVQATENKGMIVEDGMKYVFAGMEAYEKEDNVELQKISAKLWHLVNNAKKDDSSEFWKYKKYESFEDHLKDVEFLERSPLNYDNESLLNKTYSGWLGQIIGGALGTALEGYTTENITATFGEIRDYVRKPNTYNDDITFEIAFLKAFEEKGMDITSEDVALSWVGYVPMGWSAEEIALRNIRYGIMPPESGRFNNPFSDWIGAQMRGAICGQLTPGDPKEAARLAWIDGVVSHNNNGVLGEVFNAILVSLAYVDSDIRSILEKTINMMPKESEYYEIVKFAHDLSLENEDWKTTWKACEERFKHYNWIHAYPNAMAEVVALYYGKGDFDETMHIIAMCGQDVDCNAAQIMTVLGIMVGEENIDGRWKDPIGDNLDTYLRTIKKMTISGLAKSTYDAIDERYK